MTSGLSGLKLWADRRRQTLRELLVGSDLFGTGPRAATETQGHKAHVGKVLRASVSSWVTILESGWHPVRRTLMLFARRVPSFLASGFHRTLLALLLLGLIPAIAFGIAAAQVIPLVELGFFSFRGSGVSYVFATSFSMPVQTLVNLR